MSEQVPTVTDAPEANETAKKTLKIVAISALAGAAVILAASRFRTAKEAHDQDPNGLS